MTSLSAEAKVKILLATLRAIDATPNMQEVTDELLHDPEVGIDTAKTARRRYKTIVEADGRYLLTAKNKIILKDSDDATAANAPEGGPGVNAASTAANPPANGAPKKKRGRPKKATTDANEAKPAAKKARKSKEDSSAGEGDSVDNE